MALSRQLVAPFILRVKEYVQPKRRLIRLTYTHERFPVRTVVLLQITSETITMYDTRDDARNKTGGTDQKSVRVKVLSSTVSETDNSAIDCLHEMDGGSCAVHPRHASGKYANILSEHMSAERIELKCFTEEYGMTILIDEDDSVEAFYGLGGAHKTFIHDIFFLDLKAKRIDTRVPMIDGWKLDIKYIGYD